MDRNRTVGSFTDDVQAVRAIDLSTNDQNHASDINCISKTGSSNVNQVAKRTSPQHYVNHSDLPPSKRLRSLTNRIEKDSSLNSVTCNKSGVSSDSESSHSEDVESDEEYMIVEETEEDIGFQSKAGSSKNLTHAYGKAKKYRNGSNEGDPTVANDTSLVSGTRSYRHIRRKKNPRSTSAKRNRWNAAILNKDENDISMMQCCSKLKCFQTLNSTFLKNKMDDILKMKNINRKQVLYNMLGSSGKFFFDGKLVCSTFLMKAFRFSRDIQSSVKRLQNGIIIGKDISEEDSLVRTMATSTTRTQGMESIVSCLTRLADSIADRMPDSGELHLPFFRKRDVYKHFRNEMKLLNPTGDRPIPSKCYFLKIWKETCGNIKVRKTSRFAKCEICERLRAELAEAICKFKQTSDIMKQKEAHNRFIHTERMAYKLKRDKAILNPSEQWSVIIDGADQSAFGLPHFVEKTKAQRGHSLKVKLVGVLEHASENVLRLLTMTEEHESGSNHIVESLHRFLEDRSKISPVPPKLYMQLDNCTRENKNRFFFAYVESLVQWNVFDEVEVGFLPIGHTHEDIDQTFSSTSSHLRHSDAITLSDFHSTLRNVYNDHTCVGHMKHVINWSGLCQQESCLTTVSNFSHFRYFRFCRTNCNPIHQPKPTSLLTNPVHTNINSSQCTTCDVKVNSIDNWSPLHATGKYKGRGFIISAPDLRKTPYTVINEKIDNNNGSFMKKKEQFTKRLESEEGRIRSATKMNELKTLRDFIFRARNERFHWNFQTSIEWNHFNLIQEVNKDHSETREENFKHVNNVSNMERGKHLSESQCAVGSKNSYSYEVNSFVAVLTEAKDKSPSFWIGKILSTLNESNGEISKLKVHWYEPYCRKDGEIDKYTSKYAPDYVEKSIKTGSQRLPWTDVISASSVIVNFDDLLRNRQIPASVQKHLRLQIPSFASI